MTQLEIVNKILLRLREREVSTVASNDYSQLMAAFIEDIRHEMEDEYDWAAYWTSEDVTVTAGTSTASLSFTSDRDHLVYDHQHRPMVYEITTNDEMQLTERNIRDLRRWASLDPLETERPASFALYYDVSVPEWKIQFPFNLDQNRDYRIWFNQPQGDLADDGSDDNTTIQLPWRPVYLGALYLALNERGEEIGEPGNIAERRYLMAKASAVENDDRVKQSYMYRYFSNDERAYNDQNIQFGYYEY